MPAPRRVAAGFAPLLETAVGALQRGQAQRARSSQLWVLPQPGAGAQGGDRTKGSARGTWVLT